MAVTLKDIAERVGVTPATVSMVLNNKPNIGKETRRKVLKVAKELNYYPHAIARGLATKRTYAVGVVAPSLGYHFVSTVLLGIQSKIRRLDYNIVLFDTLGKKEIEQQTYRRIVREKRVDGAIVIFLNTPDESLQEFVREDIPCVVLDKDTERSSCVFVDNLEASQQATSYLIEKGHRRIALVHGPLEWPALAERKSGFEAALDAAGIEMNPAYLCEAHETEIEDGMEAARRLLSVKSRPSAVFCAAGDVVAAGVMGELRRNGFAIPDDIAVVGFGNLPIAQVTEPPLTTVQEPYFQMGAESTQILFRRLEGDRRAVERKALSTELVVRASA